MESYGSQVWQHALEDSIEWVGGVGGIILSVVIFGITAFLSWKQEGRKAMTRVIISGLKGAGVVCAAWLLILVAHLCVLAPKRLFEDKQEQIADLQTEIASLKKAMSIENKPYLWVKQISISDLEPGRGGTITLLLENAGKTPAFDITMKAGVLFARKELVSDPPEIEMSSRPSKSFIPAQGTTDHDARDFRNGFF
jgi:hypothetical protein